MWFLCCLDSPVTQIQCLLCRCSVATRSHACIEDTFLRTISWRGFAKLDVKHIARPRFYSSFSHFIPIIPGLFSIPHTPYYSQNYSGIIGASLLTSDFWAIIGKGSWTLSMCGWYHQGRKPESSKIVINNHPHNYTSIKCFGQAVYAPRTMKVTLLEFKDKLLFRQLQSNTSISTSEKIIW